MGELYTSLLQARNYAQLGAQLGAQSSDAPPPTPPPQPTYLKIDCAYAKAMLQIYMFTTVVFGVMSIAYGLGGKWWWQSLASASAADALQSGRKSDFAAILTSRVLGAAHLLVMGAPPAAAGALAGTPVPYTPPAPAPLPAPATTAPATASTPAPWRSTHRRATRAMRRRRTPRRRGRVAPRPLQLAEQLASDAAASVALVPAAAPVPRSRTPAVVPTLSPTNATVALRSGGVRRGLIAGCARNVARQLAATVEGNLEGLGAVFDDHRIAVYEEGSSDGTRRGVGAAQLEGPRLPEAAGDGRAHRAARGVPQRVAQRGEGSVGPRRPRLPRSDGRRGGGAAATALSGTIFGAAHVGPRTVPGAPADVRMDYLVMIDLDWRRCCAVAAPRRRRDGIPRRRRRAQIGGGRRVGGGGRVGGGRGAAGARWACSLATQR